MHIRIGILPKLISAFILFAAALMAVAGIVSYNSGRSALQAAIISDLLSSATEKGAALNTWISDRQSDLSIINKTPDFFDKVTALALAEPGSRLAQGLHDQVRDELKPDAGPSLEFLELDLLDPQNGEVLISTTPGEEGKFKEDRPYFTNGKKGPYVQNLYFSTTIQAPAMTAAAPVFSPDGKLVGVLAGHLNLDEMNAIINRRTGLLQTSDAFLVNSSYLPVTQPRFIPDPVVLQRSLHTPAITRCLQRTSGVTMADDYRGVPAVIVYRWLSDQGLCLIVKVDQAEAFAPSLAFGRTILIISSLALLAGALLALGLARAITRPVQQLVNGAVAIGQGNLDVRIPSKSQDEIGQLAHAFNAMAASLQTSIAALRQSENQLQLVYGTVSDAIYVLHPDPEGSYRFISINNQFLTAAGLTEDQVIGLPVNQVIPGPACSLALEKYAQAIHEKQTVTWEETAFYPGGEHIGDVSVTPVFDADGICTQLIGSIHDITQRKQAEQALLDSEERFRRIFEKSPIGMATAGSDFRFIRCNEAFCSMFGYSEQDLTNLTFKDITHPAHIAQDVEAVNKLIAGEIPQYRTEKRYVRKDQGIFWAEAAITTLRDPSGQFMYFLAVVEDITELKQTQEELKKAPAELARSNAELEHFAYIASHDLQEPLRMVTSYLQLLELRYKDRIDSDAIEFIDYAVDGATRMKTLINDLLTYSRVNTRRETFAPTNYETVLENVLADLRLSIAESGASVTHDSLPTLQADSAQMESVFQNLIGNALKFHGDQLPAIHIGAKRQPGEWLFSVRDNGIGIDPKYFERIFLIFQRLHTHDKYPGTGIGLAICQRIIQRLGGRLWVESQPGQGSIFYFTLPILGDDDHDDPQKNRTG